MSHSPIDQVIRYVLMKRLTGRVEAVMAIIDYYVNGASPSDIGAKLMVSKYRVRGWIQRVIEKCNFRSSVAVKVAGRVAAAVMDVDPIIVRVGGSALCTICGATLRDDETELRRHILRQHGEVFAALVEAVRRRLDGGAREGRAEDENKNGFLYV